MGRNRTLIFSLTLVLAALAGCAGEDGSDPADAPQDAKVSADFCDEHQIAEAQCPYCNPELAETLGFCYGHGVPEAFCYQCNPALIPAFKAVGDWCGGHDRPESQCYICNPELHPSRQRKSSEAEGSESTSHVPDPASTMGRSTDELPRSQLAPSVYCANEELVIRFESADVARQVGIELARVAERSLTQTIECNARLAYDGSRYAHLSSQVPGMVAEIHRDLGDPVDTGQPLITITSGELGAAKAAYLQALAAVELWTRNHERESGLLERGVSTERDVLEVETALAESRIAASQGQQDLLRLGLSPDQIDRVAQGHDTSPKYVLAAPFGGTVVERTTALGEVVGRDEPLFAVADVSRMWALIDVFESDIPDVQAGQAVVLQVDALRGVTLPAVITWVASHVDPHTRTLQARAELQNPGGMLKANMFARASVAVRDRHPALVVPVDAVQWEGCCNVVFVKESETVYQPRKVLLGINTGTAYEVLDGLESGEEVVTQGSFLLKTELLKGSIGAGCCEVNPGT